MSSSVESRIVSMKFDNTTFSKGVSSTLDMLSKLKTAVSGMPQSAKALSGITSDAKKVDLSSVQNQAHGVGTAFSAMAIVATTAIATVAHSAVTAGLQMGKSLTVAPISEGLTEYETNLNSIQTIMANTGLEGEKGLGIVQGALDELNHYSDKTIYNFSEMARNIGTFTAAGVDLDKSVAAIKGIANLAAVSGSTSQQASTAMYQLSQALAAGKVTLMDWNSVVNAGMGGQVLKDALMETARVHGVAVDDIVKQSGSFRDSISQGWITGEILTETLAKFTGDLSRAQLENMGYTEAQIEGIIKMGKTATDAATKVKTASALINTLQETATSGWSKTWSLILGDFFEARIMFTKANDVLGGMLSESAKQRNKMFSEWNKMGGRYAAIDAISNSFTALMNILRPIGAAWREVFPAMTGERLFEITEAIRDFTEGLIASKGTMNNIQSIFHALFGVLGVGWEVLKGILRYFFDLIGLLAGGTGGILDFSGSIADVVSGLTDWILKGDYIAKFFDKIIAGRAAVLEPIIHFFSELFSVLASLVDTGADVAIAAITDALAFLTPYLPRIESGLRAAGDAVQNYLVAGLERLTPVLNAVKDAIANALGGLSGIGGNVGGAFAGLASMFDIGDAADKAAEGIDKVKGALGTAGDVAGSNVKTGLAAFGEWLQGFGQFLLKVGGAIAVGIGWVAETLYKEISGLVSGGGEFAGSIGEFISSLFSGIGDALGDISMGDVIVALNTVLMGGIGAAIMRFIWQMGGIFKDMRGVFQSASGVLDQVTSNLKTMQTDVRSNIILKIAIALGILAAAIYVLSTIDGAGLARGLGAVATMLIMLVVAITLLEKSIPDAASLGTAMQLGAISFVLLALGLSLLALAVALKVISTLDGPEIAKGLLTMAAVLGGIIAATVALNKTGGAMSILQASIAIGILAFALTAFAGAIKLFSAIDTETMVNGGLKIVGLIIGLGLAMRAFPASTAISTAASLVIVAFALRLLVGPLKELATLSAGDSWQSVLTLGAALLVLAIGANAMNSAMAGGAALVLMAFGLKMLIPSLITLAELSWGTVLSSLAKLALIFVVLGPLGVVAGAGLLVLGAGMLLLGTGMFLAGVGMTAFAAALTVLASSGAAAGAVLVSVINRFLEAIPGMMGRFQKALISVANAIAKSGPAFVRAGSAIIAAFLRAIIKNVPLMGRALRVIIAEGLKTIRAATPDFVTTGFQILGAFLDGLLKNISDITRTAVQIIVKFINGIADGMDRIVAAGKRLVIKFVTAVAGEIGDSAGRLKDAMLDMAGDMLDGIVNGIMDGVNRVGEAVANLAGKIPGPIKKLLGISSPSKVMHQIGVWVTEGLARGLHAGAPDVEAEADAVAQRALDTMTVTMNRVSEAMALDPNMSPVITPVLDLSQMTNDANRISSLLAAEPLQAGVSFAAASALAAQQNEIEDSSDGSDGGDAPVEFHQHWHTPTAPDRVTVYRQTKNQISMAKEALKK